MQNGALQGHKKGWGPPSLFIRYLTPFILFTCTYTPPATLCRRQETQTAPPVVVTVLGVP